MTHVSDDDGKKVYIFRSSFWGFYLLYWNQNNLFFPPPLRLVSGTYEIGPQFSLCSRKSHSITSLSMGEDDQYFKSEARGELMQMGTIQNARQGQKMDEIKE